MCGCAWDDQYIVDLMRHGALVAIIIAALLALGTNNATAALSCAKYKAVRNSNDHGRAIDGLRIVTTHADHATASASINYNTHVLISSLT